MNAIVPESWRFLRLAAGYCKQFPHAKQARKKKCVNEKGRGNQTLVIQIDVFCDQRRWFLPGTGSTTKLSSGGPQTCSHPWSIIYCIHWYYIDSTLILHWYYIDIALILHWYYIDFTLILHWSVVRTTYYADLFYSHVDVSLWHVLDPQEKVYTYPMATNRLLLKTTICKNSGNRCIIKLHWPSIP